MATNCVTEEEHSKEYGDLEYVPMLAFRVYNDEGMVIHESGDKQRIRRIVDAYPDELVVEQLFMAQVKIWKEVEL